jgi:hypothetical protein
LVIFPVKKGETATHTTGREPPSCVRQDKTGETPVPALFFATIYHLPSTIYHLPSTIYPLPSTLYPLVMNSDNPTKQISFNLVAICVFGMTISSLITPLLHISSTVPILIIFAVVVGTTIDNFFLKSIGATLILDAIAATNPAYRQRIVNHEAGHFLVAYLLDIPITGYTLSAWESVKAGQSAQGGVMFAAPQTDISSQLLQHYCTVWMAGIAAEKLIFDRSEGGSEDRQKLRGVLFRIGKQQQEIVQQENLATLQAKTLIQTNWAAYQALTTAMNNRATVADCCHEIDVRLQQSATI